MSKAICPGSFDPVTYGHIDIIKRASRIFDNIIVAVLKNTSKTPLFTTDERVSFLRKIFAKDKNITVLAFDGLLADFARENKTNVIVKGLRNIADFEYEFQMSLANKQIDQSLETVFLGAKPENIFLSSGFVKQLAEYKGDISHFIPKEILDDVEKKLNLGANAE